MVPRAGWCIVPNGDAYQEPSRCCTPKIRVLDSDGVCRGGLWRPVSRIDRRLWPAPPAADYSESLIVEAEPSSMILRYFAARQPDLSGSPECDDLFDHASYAVRCNASEAVDWLERHGYSPPDDLLRRAAREKGKGAGRPNVPSGGEPGRPPDADTQADANVAVGTTSAAPEAPPVTKRDRRAKWLAEAMLLVRDHPDWSDRGIARRVHMAPSALSRSREYQAAAAMARGDKSKLPRGHIKRDGATGRTDVEGYAGGEDPEG